MLRVLVIDDEKITRDGLSKMVMDTCPGTLVVGAASNGHSGLLELERLQPDLCLVDMRMPIMDGAEFVRQARLKDARVRLVIISGYAEFDYARQLIGYGCSAYLLKPVKIHELQRAVLGLTRELDAIPVSLSRQMVKSNEEVQPDRYIIRQAVQYIRSHYQLNISLVDVADAIHMNSSYFSQLFRKEMGTTFLAYLTAYRVECAKEMLDTSSYKIVEISGMIGIPDSKYFSKVFRKATGKTPMAWRERSRTDEKEQL